MTVTVLMSKPEIERVLKQYLRSKLPDLQEIRSTIPDNVRFEVTIKPEAKGEQNRPFSVIGDE